MSLTCTGFGGPDPNSLDANASAEIYDPQNETFKATGSMTNRGGRSGHSAVLLPDGKVAILGGRFEGPGTSGSADDDLYDPETGRFSLFPAAPGIDIDDARDPTASADHETVTQFEPGRLLIIKSSNVSPASSIFNYPAGTSAALKIPLECGVVGQSATRLADGSVLIAGGSGGGGGECGRTPALALDRGASFQLINDWKPNPWGEWVFSSAEIFQSSTSGFVAVGSMSVPRFGHTATLLRNGQVLIVGGFTGESFTSSSEIFDPRAKAFRPGPVMHEARIGHSATLLANGEVLIAGGFNGKSFNRSAELYDPGRGRFEQVGMLRTARESATATLLPNHMVLITGGDSSAGVTQHCELFDPRNKQFRSTADLVHPRYAHSATLLSSGKVLIAGGGLAITPSTAAGEVLDLVTKRLTGVTSLAGIDAPTSHTGADSINWARLPNGKIFEVRSAVYSEHHKGPPGPPVISEIHDPDGGNEQLTAPMNVLRMNVTVTSLEDGRILVTGGLEQKTKERILSMGDPGSVRMSAVAELYDPRSNRFMITGRMTEPRVGHAAIRLKDGRVLIVGGGTQTAELYDPMTGKFSRTGSMATGRSDALAAIMRDGRVLIVGGSNGLLPFAEVYDPVSGTFAEVGKAMSPFSPDIIAPLSSGAVLILGQSQPPPEMQTCTYP